MASAHSPTLTPAHAPALNRATKPKRSVSFVAHAIESPPGSGDRTLARSSFRPGRRPGYVRKGPVGSDSDEDDDDDVQEEDEEHSDQDDDESSSDGSGHQHDNQARQGGDRDHEHSPTLRPDAFDDQHLKISQRFRRTVPSKTPTRPGQNYVRKAPVNSDAESDEDDNSDGDKDEEKGQNTSLVGATGVASLLRSAIIPTSQKNDDSGSDSAIAGLVRPFSGTHVSSKPGQNYVRKTPVNSDTESDDEPIQAAPKSARVLTPPANSGASYLPVNPSPNQFATMASPGYIQNPTPNPPFLASNMSMGSTSSSISDSSAAANLANSMAMYQQQQQEMMMIMQQQQIQIATMHQQQQAYQLLVLQQQQQHQQQLQAIHFLHSRGNSANGSLQSNSIGANSDDDDDVPLGEKQQQLHQLPSGLPQLAELPQLPLFAPLMETPQTPPSSLAVPQALHSTPIAQASSPLLANLQSIYPQSSSPSQSFHNGYLEQPYHPIPSSSPLQHSALIGGHSPNVRQTTPQPRLADFIEEEEERMRQEQMTGTTLFGGANHGGASLLTSSFPAGYRNSVGSMASLSQIHERDSLMPPRTAVMLGSSPSSPVMSTISLPYNAPQQPFYPVAGPAPTLIHVEPKPPPPQTGLLGAISAMERDKKLAKAHGTNQLQYQHQQHQQHLAMEAEKERWLQEQRRMVWEQQQQQQQQQRQQPQHQPYSYDDEDDNRPLGTNGPLY